MKSCREAAKKEKKKRMVHVKAVARYSHQDFDVTQPAQGGGCVYILAICIGWLEELCGVLSCLGYWHSCKSHYL